MLKTAESYMACDPRCGFTKSVEFDVELATGH